MLSCVNKKRQKEGEHLQNFKKMKKREAGKICKKVSFFFYYSVQKILIKLLRQVLDIVVQVVCLSI